jgi:phosphoglycerol transferase MdoB-like AlkP superfamily enzyme
MLEISLLNKVKAKLGKHFIPALVCLVIYLSCAIEYCYLVVTDKMIYGPMYLSQVITIEYVGQEFWLPFFFVASLLLALTGRFLLSLCMSTLLWATVLVASYSKIKYLGVPLTLSDIKFFLADIEENLVLFQTYPSLGGMLIAAGLVLATFVWWFYRVETAKQLPYRLIAALVGLFAYTELQAKYSEEIRMLTESGAVQFADHAAQELEARFDYTQFSASRLTNAFYSNVNLVAPKKLPPSGYSKVEVSQIQSRKPLPDILVALSESLMNPGYLDVCANDRQACRFNMFSNEHPYQGVSGPLLVHTHGGGTWLSEFAFLTGFDWRVFGSGGAHAPKSIAPRVQSTLVTHLKSLGYRTVAIYPVRGNFLNAREAYKHYGFDEFYAVEELGIQDGWLSTKDGVIFNKTLDLVQAKRDERPVFVFILTIFNHGPHGHQGATAALGEKDANIREALTADVADYLSRMKESDSAMDELRSKWLSSSHPRVLAWFGDHHPRFTLDLAPDPQKISNKNLPGFALDKWRFLTWYEMTSNMPDREVSKDSRVTDLAYLGTQLLKYAKVPLPPHALATQDVAAKCPYGLKLCNDVATHDQYLSYRIWELNEIKLKN